MLLHAVYRLYQTHMCAYISFPLLLFLIRCCYYYCTRCVYSAICTSMCVCVLFVYICTLFELLYAACGGSVWIDLYLYGYLNEHCLMLMLFFSLSLVHITNAQIRQIRTQASLCHFYRYQSISLSLPTCTINQMRWCDKTLILLQIKRTLASTKSIPIPIQFSSPLVLHTMITNLTNRCIDFASSDFSVCVRVCVCVRLNESVRMFAFLCYVNLTPHIIFIYFFLLLLFLWRCGKYENMKPEKSMC